jgi:3-oxoacyl-[acyl-carrier-protein] synthase II
MSRRRVVVTGLGAVSPLGIGVERVWANLIEGRSGIGPIKKFDATSLPSRIAGEISGFDAHQHLPARDVVRTDRFIQYALIAAREAVGDAALVVEDCSERVGVSVGSTMGGVELLTSSHGVLEGGVAASAYAMPGFLPNMAAGWVSMRMAARGPIACAATACAAGSQAIGDAYRLIQRGEADSMIAGGADALVTPVFISCFSSLRALSRRNSDPEAASRPFDAGRDGFVIAEGAAILILEEYEHAKARGAKLYAELTGHGLSADAHHPTALSPDGPSRAMHQALVDANLIASNVDYVNAHGTSTPQNDSVETAAIKNIFGEHAYRLVVSSIKSMTGHLIGASGALEALATVLTIKNSAVPPTINLQSPGPECDLDYVPNVARHMNVDVAMSNSFGFGGVNSVLLFCKVN